MAYTDLIFDLYGTLVDIHTEENTAVWEKTALFFSFYGARYTGPELEEAFRLALSRREADQGQSYECYPDIPVEQVMEELFLSRGVTENAHALGFQAAQLFRISSIEYLRLYPYVKEALSYFRLRGCRLWLLSNAQRAFTAYELRALGLDSAFDGIYLSSDFGCRKPDGRFFRALLQEQNLDPARCLMIGNDRETDILGAKNAGVDSIYMHTALTPQNQAPADPARRPDKSKTAPFEFEGADWQSLFLLIIDL